MGVWIRKRAHQSLHKIYWVWDIAKPHTPLEIVAEHQPQQHRQRRQQERNHCAPQFLDLYSVFIDFTLCSHIGRLSVSSNQFNRHSSGISPVVYSATGIGSKRALKDNGGSNWSPGGMSEFIMDTLRIEVVSSVRTQREELPTRFGQSQQAERKRESEWKWNSRNWKSEEVKIETHPSLWCDKWWGSDWWTAGMWTPAPPGGTPLPPASRRNWSSSCTGLAQWAPGTTTTHYI